MPLEQITVFGASVTSIVSEIGWGGQPSRMELTLVEDTSNGDSFTEPPMGTFLEFVYENFIFNGVVISWVKKYGEQGNPIFEVIVVDPREFLSGTQLILSDYYGSTSAVPNLINVYGWLESLGFGTSQINDGGIPWRNIRTAVSDAVLDVSSYGRPLNFYGVEYILDLTQLPSTLPAYYRVGGNSITLLDFIQEICDAASYNYFIDVYVSGGRNIIRVNVVNKSYTPTLGSINNFVTQTEGAIAKEVGYEARNEPSSKFIVGGQRKDMFVRYTYDIENGTRYDYNPFTQTGTNVLPFWGFDRDGFPITGLVAEEYTIDGTTYDPNPDDYTFSVDTSHLNIPGITETYTMDIAELRAAMGGYNSWVDFISSRDQTEFRSGYNDGSNNRRIPQYLRASILGGVFYNYDNLRGVFSNIVNADDFYKINILQLASLTQNMVNARSITSDDSEEKGEILFKIAQTYATEFFGKKWMVRIPFVYVAQDSETGKIRLSQEPTNGGFIDESEFDSGVANGLIPVDFDRLHNGDGQFVAYVKFDNISNLDFSGLNQDDIIISRRRYFDPTRGGFVNVVESFIKCTVEQNVIFLDPVNNLNPVVIVTLPAQIFERPQDSTNYFFGTISDTVSRILIDKVGNDNELDGILNSWLNQSGSDFLFSAKGNFPRIPAIFAVPLMSNILTYGPWYAIGNNGPSEYEFDDSLVPWNYGGYSAMNLVGNSKVSQAYLNQQTSEYGKVSFPGVPLHSLGQELLNGGPYITSIDITIGENGVFTNYAMNTWTPQFGKRTKAFTDRITRINLRNNQLRRAFRTFIKNRPPNRPTERQLLEKFIAESKIRNGI